ncbi:type IV pilus assembly protein PilA [Xanthomonas arboricola]|uniref:pilin n=1 Tax=Xanthomonas euroxanthea TaxID=2259622 RepID=UPI0014311B2D|nr:pilin [Xanthomonas euroxanthea]NJC38804.1 type IV pilus assembly protein PilA [Xanthomonas euroxanthea]
MGFFPGRLSGYSLVELMVVVGIVAVLASVSLPAYQNYLVRARISEALTDASGLKALVIGNASSGAPDLAMGFSADESVPSKNVEKVAINGSNGVITVSTTGRAGGGVITLIPVDAEGDILIAGRLPKGDISWVCKSALRAIYIPRGCISE